MEIFHEIRKYKDDFMVWSQSYGNMRFLAHWHNEIELIYVRRGKIEISVNGTVYIMGEGDLLVCDSRSVHYSDTYDTDNFLEFLLFDPRIIFSDNISRHANILFKAADMKEKGLDSKFEGMLRTIKDELEERNIYYKKVVRAAITEFWYNIIRFFPERYENEQDLKQKSLKKLLEYIGKNFNQDIELKFAAEKVGLTPNYFSFYFKKNVGINFIDYLQTLRIDEAIRRLQKENTKIIDIALDTGFKNVRNFNRVFKRLTGLTPNEFRKNNNENYYYYFPRIHICEGDELSVEHDSFVVLDNKKPR